MQWEEVRKIYPNQYVKLQILASHTEGNTKFVDEVALIRAIQDPQEATMELLQSKDGVIVSHTGNEKLKVEIRVFCRPRVARMARIHTDEQKKQMTSIIFNDEGVLSQLQQAQKDRRDGISTYSDSEEEFAQLLNKTQNE
ncbi:hypothetical protein MKX70_29600 [Paenibacillus sp. FSL R7-0312]|uniref:hypothetical protein n=1 Tax=unclassified Paenibacillus TaxID=185978 RepID=UPI0007C85658|nr:hypothetical protein [Paenibacillus sp. FSL R5-0912]